MSYDAKFERVKTALLASVRQKIQDRHTSNGDFYSWNYSEVSDAYSSAFNGEFLKHMNAIVTGKLLSASKGLSFAVQGFLDINPNCTLESLLTFVDTFVTRQLNDIENWCGNIRFAVEEDERVTEYFKNTLKL